MKLQCLLISKIWTTLLHSNRFDAKPNQNLIAIRREPLVQLNKDIRNVAGTASTYGENGMIENGPKKLTSGVIASENEVKLSSYICLTFHVDILFKEIVEKLH